MQQQTRALLIGLILGDGYLTKPNGHANTSTLDIKYDEKSLEYLQWIHKELQELSPSPIKKKKNYHQYRFYTKASAEVGELRRLFYPHGIKRIPEDIQRYLKDPLTLAVWYQDDGTLDFRKGYHANALIATHCFSLKECELLASALHANFGLDVRVCKCTMRGKQFFRLYVVSQSMNCFMNLIDPYIRKCFFYKVVRHR